MGKRAKALSLRNFDKGCTRYENFLLTFDANFKEQQQIVEDMSKTWFNLQSKHERYLLTFSEDNNEADMLWIDETETKFHELR